MKARVVWSGGGVRVCLKGDAVVVQAVDLSARPPAWGPADPLLALSALSLAVVALASGPSPAARRRASGRGVSAPAKPVPGREDGNSKDEA